MAGARVLNLISVVALLTCTTREEAKRGFSQADYHLHLERDDGSGRGHRAEHVDDEKQGSQYGAQQQLLDELGGDSIAQSGGGGADSASSPIEVVTHVFVPLEGQTIVHVPLKGNQTIVHKNRVPYPEKAWISLGQQQQSSQPICGYEGAYMFPVHKPAKVLGRVFDLKTDKKPSTANVVVWYTDGQVLHVLAKETKENTAGRIGGKLEKMAQEESVEYDEDGTMTQRLHAALREAGEELGIVLDDIADVGPMAVWVLEKDKNIEGAGLVKVGEEETTFKRQLEEAGGPGRLHFFFFILPKRSGPVLGPLIQKGGSKLKKADGDVFWEPTETEKTRKTTTYSFFEFSMLNLSFRDKCDGVLAKALHTGNRFYTPASSPMSFELKPMDENGRKE